MAKRPSKPSINAALADIAEQGDIKRGNVATAERDSVGTATMATSSQQRGPVATDNVTTPEGYKLRRRIEKPHVSLYVHPKVIRTVREIALAKNRKAHDIYVDGLRMALKAYGYDYDELSQN